MPRIGDAFLRYVRNEDIDQSPSRWGRRKGHGAALPEPPAARRRRLWIVWLEGALNKIEVAGWVAARDLDCQHRRAWAFVSLRQ